MSTVNEILKKSHELADTLHLSHVLLVFDQAIYSKIQQIRWKDKAWTNRFIIRLGEFHTAMAFLAVIGKRYADAGMKDIMIESQIVAEGSINGVVSGHHYNRSIRSHKLLAESLQRLRFRAFLESLSQTDERYVHALLCKIADVYPSDEFFTISSSDAFTTLISEYDLFVHRQGELNPTFAFWSSYIEIVQLLLLFIRGTRESDWNLHLSAIRYMLPWFFSYDRYNYARYLPAYWLEMISLPITHPDVQKSITSRGHWTVQQSGAGFSSIACDQAIEQTLNRDSKTPGGLTGITLNHGAVYRWILSQNERAAIVRQCESMADTTHNVRSRKELGKCRIVADERCIENIISVIESMQNPFDARHTDLINISSGVVASSEVQNDLMSAYEKGEKALGDFIDKRLISPSADFFAPLKAIKLKTFSDMGKSKSKTKSGKEVMLRSDKQLFSRLLIIAQARNIDLREIMCYSLSPVSMPLATVDGSLVKTTKSALLDAIESHECLVSAVPDGSALIIDGMGLIHSMQHIGSTFGAVADAILMRLLVLTKKFNCHRVDFVTDRYPSISIKNFERVRRGDDGRQAICIYSKNQPTPTQWKKFLSNGKNKEALVEFLFTVWSETDVTTITDDISIYIAHGPVCHRLHIHDSTLSVHVVEELVCNHEEGDTRVLLHANHASSMHPNIVIHSPDTDVAVIAISLSHSVSAHLYFVTGVKNKARIIDLTAITFSLGMRVSNAMIGLHTFTGCDSTSAFYGRGKRKALSIMRASEDFTNAFIELGDEFSPSDSLIDQLQVFVCCLYGQTKSVEVNDARYKIFCLASSSPCEQSMPPTKDALIQHTKRAAYQAAIYRRSLQPIINIPNPDGHGWTMSYNELSINWMTDPPAPDSVLELISCKCIKSKCRGMVCSCQKSGLSCTDFCMCHSCMNRMETAVERQLRGEREGGANGDDEGEDM